MSFLFTIGRIINEKAFLGFFFCLVIFSSPLAAQKKYPAIVAMDPETGFVIDSIEAAKNDYFPEFVRSGLIRMVVVLERENTFQVKAYYMNGTNSSQRFDEDVIKSERGKVTVPVESMEAIPDYSITLNIYPSIKTYYIISNDFEFVLYDPDNKQKTSMARPVFFGNLGLGYFSIADKELAMGVQGILNLRLNHIVFSAEITSVRNDFFLPDGAKDDYRLRDINVRAGYMFLERRTQLVASTGFSFIYTKSILDGGGNPDIVSADNYTGIPLLLTFMVPVRSSVGFYAAYKYNIVFGGDSAWGITFGFRIGKSTIRGFKNANAN